MILQVRKERNKPHLQLPHWRSGFSNTKTGSMVRTWMSCRMSNPRESRDHRGNTGMSACEDASGRTGARQSGLEENVASGAFGYGSSKAKAVSRYGLPPQSNTFDCAVAVLDCAGRGSPWRPGTALPQYSFAGIHGVTVTLLNCEVLRVVVLPLPTARPM